MWVFILTTTALSFASIIYGVLIVNKTIAELGYIALLLSIAIAYIQGKKEGF